MCLYLRYQMLKAPYVPYKLIVLGSICALQADASLVFGRERLGTVEGSCNFTSAGFKQIHAAYPIANWYSK